MKTNEVLGVVDKSHRRFVAGQRNPHLRRTQKDQTTTWNKEDDGGVGAGMEHREPEKREAE